MFDFLDFNDNGGIDPLEAGFAMSMIGGLGAVMSEAEEREACREAQGDADDGLDAWQLSRKYRKEQEAESQRRFDVLLDLMDDLSRDYDDGDDDFGDDYGDGDDDDDYDDDVDGLDEFVGYDRDRYAFL